MVLAGTKFQEKKADNDFTIERSEMKKKLRLHRVKGQCQSMMVVDLKGILRDDIFFLNFKLILWPEHKSFSVFYSRNYLTVYYAFKFLSCWIIYLFCRDQRRRYISSLSRGSCKILDEEATKIIFILFPHALFDLLKI